MCHYFNKANRSGNLYVLQDVTVIGTATVFSLSLSDLEVTKLWHIRLGHMSDRGMTILSKVFYVDRILTNLSSMNIAFLESIIE